MFFLRLHLGKDAKAAGADDEDCTDDAGGGSFLIEQPRAEEHGVVQIHVNRTHLRSDFIAVDTDEVGTEGLVYDSVTLSVRRLQ